MKLKSRYSFLLLLQCCLLASLRRRNFAVEYRETFRYKPGCHSRRDGH